MIGTIIEFNEHLTVVDINACRKFAAPTRAELRKKYAGSSPLLNLMAESALSVKEQELIDPVAYIKTKFPGKAIFRYVQSHPDMDHMAGLHRLVNEEKIRILSFGTPITALKGRKGDEVV